MFCDTKYKRLSQGRFTHWPAGDAPARALEAHQLQVLLAGGDADAARGAAPVASRQAGHLKRPRHAIATEAKHLRMFHAFSQQGNQEACAWRSSRKWRSHSYAFRSWI